MCNRNIETFWYRKPYMKSSHNSKIFENITNLFLYDVLFQKTVLVLPDKYASIPLDKSVLLKTNINIGNIETYWYRKLCMKTCYTSKTFESSVNVFISNVYNGNIEIFWCRKLYMKEWYNSKFFEYITSFSSMIFHQKYFNTPNLYAIKVV